MIGLLALACIGVAVALALGFAISIWWLRPQRDLTPRSGGVDPIEPTGALPVSGAGSTNGTSATTASVLSTGTGHMEEVTPAKR